MQMGTQALPAVDVIDRHTVRELAMGAAVIGSGASSFPYAGHLAAREILEERGPVSLTSPLALADNARVALVAMAGAPLALQERLIDPEHFARPIALLAQHLGVAFDAVMAYEFSPTNALLPVMVAARMGLPLVSADTAGRAFPEFQMTTFSIAGLDMAPIALSDIRRNDMIIARAESTRWIEQLLRSISTSCGAIIAICGAHTGLQIKRHAIFGTYARALRLGSAILGAQAEHRDAIESILSVDDGRLLAKGKIVDVERRATDGWVRGQAVIEIANHPASPVVVHFQNEYTIVSVGDRPLAMMPDIVAILDSEKGEPLGTEALRYGQHVSVIRLSPPERFLTPEALKMVGPRAYAYDFDYCPPASTVLI
jgi:hypothetical protein